MGIPVLVRRTLPSLYCFISLTLDVMIAKDSNVFSERNVASLDHDEGLVLSHAIFASIFCQIMLCYVCVRRPKRSVSLLISVDETFFNLMGLDREECCEG